MAKSKTGSFWLTDVATLSSGSASGTVATATIDLGAYVDVGDQQALAIESVDFMYQRGTANSADYVNMLRVMVASRLNYWISTLVALLFEQTIIPLSLMGH